MDLVWSRRTLLLSLVVLAACGSPEDNAAPETTTEEARVACPDGVDPVTSLFDEDNALVRTPGEALGIAVAGEAKLSDKTFAESMSSTESAEYVYREEGVVVAAVVVERNEEKLWRVDRIQACPAFIDQ